MKMEFHISSPALAYRQFRKLEHEQVKCEIPFSFSAIQIVRNKMGESRTGTYHIEDDHDSISTSMAQNIPETSDN